MALSLPAVYVTSTSFCQVLCSHFLLAAFTTVPWISFITLVYGCGKQKKRMMEYSLLPLAFQRLFQSPSTCGCFVGWVFNCYSGSNLQCSSRESGGLLGLIGVWGAPSLGSYRRRVPQAPPPGTLPAWLFFISSDMIDMFVFIGCLPSPHWIVGFS